MGSEMCIRDSIPHRELRNSSGKILRAAADGEDFIVTNRGQDMALITQVPQKELRNIADGMHLRRATRALNTDINTLIVSPISSEEMLKGLRDD